MSFSPIKIGGWGINDMLASTSMNLFQTNMLNSLDKSSAGDTLNGAINLGATGNVNIPVLAALNWAVPVSVNGSIGLVRGAYCDKDQTWYGVGNGGGDWLMQSQDDGQSWTQPSLGATLTLQDVGCDPNGNVLATGGSRDIYYGTRASYGNVTFVHTASALSASGTGTLSFDPANGKWIVAYRNGAAGQKLDTSATGTSFTARTLPATWTAYTGSNDPRVATDAAGTSLVTFYDEVASLLRIIRSTDGGTTWVDVFDGTAAFTPTSVSKPVYDPVNEIWYIAVGKTGTRQTQIFYSTNDGVGWSAVAWTTNDFCAEGLVAVGGWLVAVNDDGRVAYSPGAGGAMAFSWVGRPLAASSTVTAIIGGGGVGIFWAGARTFVRSVRFGSPGQAI
jgi:hypothetical protein